MVDFVMKWVLRAVAAFFALGAFATLAGTLFGLAKGGSKGTGDMFALVLLLGFLALMLWYWAGSADRARADNKRRHESIAQEATSFFESVNSSRQFPPANAERVLDRPDNPVLAACDATLMEVTADQARNYLGTRIKVGGMPIYLGRSASSSRAVTKATAKGELALTPTALVFNGAQRSADVDLRKITAIDIALDGISVAIKGKQKPLIFMVPNGLLWGQLVKNLAQIHLTGRELPAGVNLQVL